MSGGVTVKGMDSLVGHLAAIGKGVLELPGFHGIAARAAGLARSFAPHRTGELAQSIQPSATTNRATVVALAPHAKTINYGSRRRNIQPARFMQRVDSAIANQARASVDRAVDQLAQRGSQ